MKKIVSLILLFLVCSCGTMRNVQYVPYEVTKTEYIHQIDTTIIRDSVWLQEITKRDTVYLTKEKYKYVTKIKRDTLYRCDTIPVIKEVEVEKEVVPPYYQKINALFWVLAAVLILIVGWKVFKIIRKI